MDFPTKFLGQLRKADKLDDCLNSLCDICIDGISKGSVDSLEKLCQGYIRAVYEEQLPEENQRLRTVIAQLVFGYRLMRNSSVESQWHIVCIYGPTNYTKTINYLNSLPAFFHPKMKRLLLVCKPNKQAAAILFNSSFKDIITLDWLAQIKSDNPEIHLIAHHYNAGPDVEQLRMLFPQLGINRAQRLLKGSSVEQATQRLLDDEDAGKVKEKKVFVPLEKIKNQKVVVDREKNLRMAYALMDDVIDDRDAGDMEIAFLETPERISRSESIMERYKEDPSLFDRSNRGSFLRKNFLDVLNSTTIVWKPEPGVPTTWSDDTLEEWKEKLDRGENPIILRKKANKAENGKRHTSKQTRPYTKQQVSQAKAVANQDESTKNDARDSKKDAKSSANKTTKDPNKRKQPQKRRKPITND